jgi:hypothetical protein
MTYLQLVNAVLRRLREGEVTTVQGSSNTNAYARLVGDFVNEAKAAVEAAWIWDRLSNQIQVNTVASTDSYIVSGTTHRYNIDKVLLPSENVTLQRRPLQWIDDQKLLSTVSNAVPYFYAYDGVDLSTNSIKIRLFPTPDAVYQLQVFGNAKQTELSADADKIYVPDRPVILLATAMAIEERGENGGQPSIYAFQVAQNALADEIALDAAKNPELTTWYAQ